MTKLRNKSSFSSNMQFVQHELPDRSNASHVHRSHLSCTNKLCSESPALAALLAIAAGGGGEPEVECLKLLFDPLFAGSFLLPSSLALTPPPPFPLSLFSLCRSIACARRCRHVSAYSKTYETHALKAAVGDLRARSAKGHKGAPRCHARKSTEARLEKRRVSTEQRRRALKRA